MAFPDYDELEDERVVSVNNEVLIRSLLGWSNNYESKSRTFAVFFLATLLGVYALMAISISIALSPQLSILRTNATIGWLMGYWSLMNLLFYILMIFSVYCAVHAFWYANLSTKGLQWLQTINYPNRPGFFSIERFLIDGGGRQDATPIMGHRFYRGFQYFHKEFLLGLLTLTFVVTLLFGYFVSLVLEVVTFTGLIFPTQYPWFLYLLGISPWSMALTSLILFLALSVAFLGGIYVWSYSKHSQDIDRIQTIMVKLKQARQEERDTEETEPRKETPLQPDVFQELEDIIQSYRRE
ncbi:MAG: hypothetical protein ACFFBX_09895 [Promethearchaeota archaeon]